MAGPWIGVIQNPLDQNQCIHLIFGPQVVKGFKNKGSHFVFEIQ